MNKLSSRLLAVSNFIDEKDKFMIDIGCDHGLLSIYLASKYKNLKVIASDVNKNALDNAISNIKDSHLDERINVRLGSGLEVISNDNIDTIVISGMGANTIVGILKYSSEKLIHVNKIVIQSNTDLFFLRKNMMNIGYYVEDEVLVKDKEIIYIVIKFIKGKKKYNYKELYFGPILIKKNDSLFKEKNDKELKTLKMILNNIKKGHYLYKLKIKKNIKLIEKLNIK